MAPTGTLDRVWMTDACDTECCTTCLVLDSPRVKADESREHRDVEEWSGAYFLSCSVVSPGRCKHTGEPPLLVKRASRFQGHSSNSTCAAVAHSFIKVLCVSVFAAGLQVTTHCSQNFYLREFVKQIQNRLKNHFLL